MNFVADENIHVKIITSLRSEGYEVLSIRELHPSIPDTEVLQFARAHRGILITEDKDFGEIAFRDGNMT